MPKNNISGKVAIVGIGETQVGKVPDKTTWDLYMEASVKAMEHAGVQKKDIDGFVPSPPRPLMVALPPKLAEYMGMQLRYIGGADIGGAANVGSVIDAAAAILSGQADVVLCTTAAKGLTGKSDLSAEGRDEEVRRLALSAGLLNYEIPYGFMIPATFAFLAQRHMYEFGTTSEQLAKISVETRANALMNPGAQMFPKGPITIEDVINSKMIADPIHMFDLALISDGGAALIVTSAERAKDITDKPVYILGMGEGHTHDFAVSDPDYCSRVGATMSSQRAFEMAGLTPKDIDVAELYDASTILVIELLESIGFCKRGEGGPFVESHKLTWDGDFPMNTHGGLLSFGHPGLPGGMYHVLEAVRQLRGEAGDRQVKNAKIALAHNCGGSASTHGSLVLSNVLP